MPEGPARRILILAAHLLAMLLVGLVDRLVGPDYEFTVVYVPIVISGTIFAGLEAGIILAAAASVSMLVADDLPSGLPAGALAWNFLSRIGVFGAVAYLTDRLRRQARDLRTQAESLRQKTEELEQDLRTRSDYMAVLAHELRNPLISIVAATRALSLKAGAEPVTAAIVDEARSALGLVEGLTDVSSIESGRMRSVLAPLDLSALITRTVAGEHLGERVSLRGADGTIIVQGDELRLAQVIRNLLTNAVKYSPPTSPIEIIVGLARGQRDAVVSVRDYGPGIPGSERDRLFQKFVRLSTAADVRGSGLGLYISRQIIEEHRGQITADWPSGGGTQFTLILPLARSLAPQGS